MTKRNRQNKNKFRRPSKAILDARTLVARETVSRWLAKRGHLQPEAFTNTAFAAWTRGIVTGDNMAFRSSGQACSYIRQMAMRMRQSDYADEPESFTKELVRQAREYGIRRKRTELRPKRKPTPKYLRNKGARAWLAANDQSSERCNRGSPKTARPREKPP